MDDLKSLAETIHIQTMELQDFTKSASKIQATYDSVYNCYTKLSETVKEADKFAAQFLQIADNYQKNLDKINWLKNDIQTVIISTNKTNEFLQNLESATRPVHNRPDNQNQNMTKQFSQYIDETKNINKTLTDILTISSECNKITGQLKLSIGNFAQSDDIKNVNKNILDLSKNIKTINSSLNSLYNSVNSLIESRDNNYHNELKEIKEIVLSLSVELHNHVENQVQIPSASASIKKSNITKKASVKRIVPEWEIILKQLKHLNIDIEDELAKAINEFVKNANIIRSDNLLVLVSDESDLNIYANGKDGRAAWSNNYHANIDRIEISENNVFFYGSNVYGNGTVVKKKRREIELKDLWAYSLL